jgi:hypothetical protein
MCFPSKSLLVPYLLVAIATWSLAPADASGAQARKSHGSGAKADSATENAPSDGAGSASSKSFGSSSGNSSTSSSRSISFTENGRKVAITENSRNGITVKITETVDGKPETKIVQAANAADLAKKDAAAYDLYKRHLGGKTGGHASASGGSSSSGMAASSGGGHSSKSGSKHSSSHKSGSSASGGGGSGSATGRDARDMLREQIRKMKKEHADDPAIGKMLDEVIEQIEKD